MRIRRMSLIFFLSVCLFAMPLSSVPAASSSDSEVTQLEIPLNTSEQSIRAMSSANFVRGQITFFNQSVARQARPSGGLHLTLRMIDNVVHAHGHFELRGRVYPFSDLRGGYLINDDNVVVTGLFGEMETNRGSQDVGFILVYDKSNPDFAFSSMTVGAINELRGSAVFFFGTPFIELAPEDIASIPRAGGIRPEPDTDTSNYAASNTRGGLNSVTDPKILSESAYEHRGSEVGTTLGESNWAQTEPSYYNDASAPVIVIDAYDRDPSVNGNGSGSLEARLWSFNDNVINYAEGEYGYGTPTSYVDVGWVHMRETWQEGYIHLKNIYPDEPDLSTTLDRWQWVSYVPYIGDYVYMAANYYINQTRSVVHHKWTSGRTYKITVEVDSLLEDADYPYSNPYISYEYGDGGLTVKADYEEYASGYHSFSTFGRIRYFVFVGYYLYLWTEWEEVRWSANMLT